MRDTSAEPLTLLVTLQNDSWVPELGQGFNGATIAFAAGITAAESNMNSCQEYADDGSTCVKGGWMSTVQPALLGPSGYLRITRLSDLQVRSSAALDPGPGPIRSV